LDPPKNVKCGEMKAQRVKLRGGEGGTQGQRFVRRAAPEAL